MSLSQSGNGVTSGGGRPRSPKGIARRQQILARAMSVFAEKGARGTSLRAIAEDVGVSHGALLHYFPSQEALLLEVLQENEYRPDSHLVGGVVGLMASAAERNVTIPGLVSLYTIMLAGSSDPANTRSHDYFADRFRRLWKELVDEIRCGQMDGTFRRDVDPASMAALVVAACDGLQTQWMLEPDVDMAQSLMLLNLILDP